jgi:hypothetical protein
MRFLVWFMLLAGPDYRRADAVPIHPDIPYDEPTHFGYGQVLSVGDDEVPSVWWPRYSVADIPFMSIKPVADPERPGQRAYVEQVFLVGESEWEQFPMPQHIHELLNRQGRTPADTLRPD